MTKSLESQKRAQSHREEIANSVSHGVAFLAAVAVSPVLIVSAVQRYSPSAIVGASIFAFTMVLLYITSALYHILPGSKAKRVLRILDHSAIFLLIAGTYTPFTLGVLRGAWGWTLFGLVWGIAVVGVALKSIGGVRYKKLSTLLYLAMGWLIIIAVKPLWLNMPSQGLFWLAAGGVAYTAGVGFYAAKRIPYAHFVWHLFVIAGTACHFIAVLKYAA
ncbi:MAG: hemolysin III family protein [Planctomycetes bacterium]|nr:hemolysin III family protein [Planctomycetota bacterium]MBL7145516.1 hemolysin III family protein [Phycisphaerae bacterium]